MLVTQRALVSNGRVEFVGYGLQRLRHRLAAADDPGHEVEGVGKLREQFVHPGFLFPADVQQGHGGADRAHDEAGQGTLAQQADDGSETQAGARHDR